MCAVIRSTFCITSIFGNKGFPFLCEMSTSENYSDLHLPDIGGQGHVTQIASHDWLRATKAKVRSLTTVNKPTCKSILVLGNFRKRIVFLHLV